MGLQHSLTWSITLLSIIFNLWALPATAFDHFHSGWTGVLGKYQNPDGRFQYRQLKADVSSDPQHTLLKYLKELEEPKRAEYDSWPKEMQIAFLINSYNALTVKLIIDTYPIKTIKDAGSLFTSPWKKEFFSLLESAIKNLDQIENKFLQTFNDPRIHFTLSAASVSSPKLLHDAYQVDLLDSQLDNAFREFLADKTKNRFDGKNDVIYLSQVFEWDTGDFEKAYGSLLGTIQKFGPPLMSAFTAKTPKIKFLTFDSNLNEPDADREVAAALLGGH